MISDYGVLTAIMPQGGMWHYLQDFEGGQQRIPHKGCAGTPDDLVKMVKLFRANAHIDLGDPEADVADYIKRSSPINIRFKKRERERQAAISVAPPKKKHKPLISRIRDWLLVTGPRQPVLLNEDYADERTAICMKCPQNVKWANHCIPCVEAVKSRGHNVRQRAGYKHDDSLGACRLHNLFLPTAVFIDQDFLPDRHPDAPVVCWVAQPNASSSTPTEGGV